MRDRARELVADAASAAERRTIKRLRAFTGVGTVVPDMDQPEHLAYLRYRDELREQVSHLRNGVAHRERQLDAATHEAHEADVVSDDARSRLGPMRWIVCTRRRRAAQAHRNVELLTSRLDDVDELHRRAAAELSAVQDWLSQWLAAAEAERSRQCARDR